MDENPYASPQHSGRPKGRSQLTFEWHSIAALVCALASFAAMSLSLRFASRSMIVVAAGGPVPDDLVRMADELHWCAIAFVIAATVLAVQSVRKGTPVARLVVIAAIILAVAVLVVTV